MIQLENSLLYNEKKLILLRTSIYPVEKYKAREKCWFGNPFQREEGALAIRPVGINELYIVEDIKYYSISTSEYKKFKESFNKCTDKIVLDKGDGPSIYIPRMRYIPKSQLVMGKYEELIDYGVWIEACSYTLEAIYDEKSINKRINTFINPDYKSTEVFFSGENVLTRGISQFFITFYDIKEEVNIREEEKYKVYPLYIESNYIRWNFKKSDIIPNILRYKIISSSDVYYLDTIFESMKLNQYEYVWIKNLKDKTDLIAKIRVEKYSVETLLSPYAVKRK